MIINYLYILITFFVERLNKDANFVDVGDSLFFPEQEDEDLRIG
jgi:hypothetical protein